MLPNFPEFKKLTLEDKDTYNELVKEYPPFSDISFTNLHIWWNLGGQLAATVLNSNVVLNYNLPFDKPNCGWGLIGKTKIDESVAEIFNLLKSKDREQKIVHMPEFTVECLTDKSLYSIVEESDFHEYIMSSHELAQLEGRDHSRTRRKVNRFLREVEGHKLEIWYLDLNSKEVKSCILDAILSWHKKYPSQNDPERLEEQALKATLENSEHLETKNLCVFVDDKLHGVVLFHGTPDGQHYILNHLKVDYEFPYIFDYLTNQIAKHADDHGIPFLNMEMDLGLEGLRQHKMGLRPVNFYKKYTVRPLV